MSGLTLSAEGGAIYLKGEMTFATVSAALDESAALFVGAGDLYLNLKGVRRVDSAGVSLLLEWVRQMRAQQRQLRISSPPHALQRLAAIGGVAELLLVDA